MGNAILTEAIEALASRRDLSAEQAAAVLAEIMEGNASEVQTAAVLIALRTKGETVDELVGLATTMRRLAKPVRTSREDLIDTAGTGGGRPTFNVSTTAALIAAGAGCAVAKHGNRSATGLSGSADLLEALGVRIDLEPEAVARCIEQAGFGFMFAPAHHGATRFVVPVRKELAVRTIFNFLGPLTNPAGADPAGDRGVRRRVPGHDRRSAGAAWRREGAGSVQRRRSGRDEHVGDNARRGGRRAGGSLLRGVPRGRRAAACPPGGARRRHAGPQRRDHAADLRRRDAARSATSRCSTRARRSTSPAAPTRSRRACARPRRRSTTAARPPTLERLVEMTQELAPA